MPESGERDGLSLVSFLALVQSRMKFIEEPSHADSSYRLEAFDEP